jgi:hypothetical protein
MDLVKAFCLICGLVFVSARPAAAAQSDSAAASAAQQQAFDFEFGAWKVHISRLLPARWDRRW